MRKADLVNKIADKTGIAKVDVLVTLEAFFKEVKESLVDGENVYVRGFGSFIIKKRAKQIGRHIKKNKAIEIPEHYIPAFKPAKVFAESIKNSNLNLYQVEVPVSINISDSSLSDIIIDEILQSIDDFMNSLGFELEGKNEPIFGSYYQDVSYKSKEDRNDNGVNQQFQETTDEINQVISNQGLLESTERLTETTIKLINSLDKINEGVIRLGIILIVKVQVNGRSVLIVESMTPEIEKLFAFNSSLIRNPIEVYKLLTNSNKLTERKENTVNREIETLKNSDEFKNGVKSLLSKGKINEAFKVCEKELIKLNKNDEYNSLITQQSKFNISRSNLSNGIIDSKTSIQINSQITSAILEIIDRV